MYIYIDICICVFIHLRKVVSAALVFILHQLTCVVTSLVNIVAPRSLWAAFGYPWDHFEHHFQGRATAQQIRVVPFTANWGSWVALATARCTLMSSKPVKW